MRFYTQAHKHYCGIDLHARQMYLCILDGTGSVLLSRNIACTPQAFLSAVRAFRDDLVVAVECMFTWYWLSRSHQTLVPDRATASGRLRLPHNPALPLDTTGSHKG